MNDERDDTTGPIDGGDAGGPGAQGAGDGPGDRSPGSGAGTGDRDSDPGAGTGSGAGAGTGPVDARRESWACTGPAELEITIGGGDVRIDLVEDAAEVRVEVSADRSGAPWSGGLGGLLDWIGTSMSGGGAPPAAGWSGRGFEPIVGAPWERTGDPSAEAVDAVTVEWSGPGGRLVVRGPDEPGLSSVPLSVTVSAPAGSRAAVRTGAAGVRVTGRASWAAVRTGSGTARVAEVTGDADITTGSGGIDLGSCGGRAELRTGGGGVEAGSLAGPSRVRTGSGDVRLGQVTGDLEIRSGSGDLVLADAVCGDVRVSTGSGNVRVGVHSGVAAELDLSTGSGRARSELDVRHDGPPSPAAVRLSGRTGSGDVLVGRAAAVAG
ncbi:MULTISPECIES: DUF4097 family beta strand repeat-containing protein [unclassified Pseudonocardia]|uniref:DUF4097 family beta strand repeat-containing protein n=1 Tax=unclassified Pseudonocardia TaxID=2619320 RepID=UPI00095D72D0|nr:DUF4097 family beta strand repeat-containing protein [Pseudonocardia sp. Ae707_Ps1]OLM17259.1 hypothetical protein Ae707Ps1_1518c [Pseudonocardia sp. Ae707_Ps1]